MTEKELMLVGLNNIRNEIVKKMYELNKQWTHDHPNINVNHHPDYKKYVKELYEVDYKIIEIKESV